MNSNFRKKTFGVPRIANLENGNKFCIFKKIRNGKKYFSNTWFSSFFLFLLFLCKFAILRYFSVYDLMFFFEKKATVIAKILEKKRFCIKFFCKATVIPKLIGWNIQILENKFLILNPSWIPNSMNACSVSSAFAQS